MIHEYKNEEWQNNNTKYLQIEVYKEYKSLANYNCTRKCKITFLIQKFNRLKLIPIVEHYYGVGIFYLCSSYKSIHTFDTNLPKNSCLLRQNASYEYHPGFYLQNI